MKVKELQSTSTKEKEIKELQSILKRDKKKYNYYPITNWTCCSKSPLLGMEKELLFSHEFSITNNK